MAIYYGAYNMGFVCPTTKTRMLSHIIFKTLIFYSNNGYANAPHCYVIHTLPVLLQTSLVRILLARL